MKKGKEPSFYYDESTGVTNCVLTDGKRSYLGCARCSTIDKDMQNEKTGCTIALMRAEINYYTSVRDDELIPSLNALKGILFSFEQCYINLDAKKIVQRRIHKIENDLATIRYMINSKEQELTQYIKDKDTFYKQVRKNREKAKES